MCHDRLYISCERRLRNSAGRDGIQADGRQDGGQADDQRAHAAGEDDDGFLAPTTRARGEERHEHKEPSDGRGRMKIGQYTDADKRKQRAPRGDARPVSEERQEQQKRGPQEDIPRDRLQQSSG